MCCRVASSRSALRSIRRQTPYDALDVLGGTGAADRQQALLVLGVATRVSARTLAYDGTPRGAPPRGAAGTERAGDAHLLAGGPEVEPTRQVSHSAQERKPLFQPPRV